MTLDVGYINYNIAIIMDIDMLNTVAASARRLFTIITPNFFILNSRVRIIRPGIVPIESKCIIEKFYL